MDGIRLQPQVERGGERTVPPAGERAVPRSGASLQLLDGFRLFDGQAEVGMPAGCRRLVAFMALSRPTLPRQYVSAQLWTDSSEKCAMGSLRGALCDLRQIGPDVIEATRDTLTLTDAVAIDLTETTARANGLVQGDESIEGIGPADFTRSLLPDWYEDWVLFERERVRQLFLHALDRLTLRLADEGRYAEAIDAGLSSIRVEPLRESTWRALIQVHLAEGNRGEAMRCFRTFSRMIRSELGFGPSERMEALAAGIGRS